MFFYQDAQVPSVKLIFFPCTDDLNSTFALFGGHRVKWVCPSAQHMINMHLYPVENVYRDGEREI